MERVYQDLKLPPLKTKKIKSKQKLVKMKREGIEISDKIRSNKEKWISSITVKNLGIEGYKEEFNRYIHELVEENLDFEQKIEHQGNDIKNYSYFLLAVYHLLHGISYYEAVQLVHNIKNEYKIKSSRRKSSLYGMKGVNFYSNLIKFSQPIEDNSEILEGNDKVMVQLCLLNFLENFEGMRKIYLSTNLSEEYKITIYIFGTLFYNKLYSKLQKTNKTKKVERIHNQIREVQGLIFNPKIVNDKDFNKSSLNKLVLCNLTSKYHQIDLRFHHLRQSLNKLVLII